MLMPAKPKNTGDPNEVMVLLGTSEKETPIAVCLKKLKSF